MTRWSPERRALLEGLAAELLHNYGKGRTIVAVDGVSGTARFADDLARALRTAGHDVFRASMADFLRPRALREGEGRDAVRARYEGAYDEAALRRVLIEPYRLNGSTGFVTAHWDAARDRQVEPKWVTGPLDAILVIDGPFLNRPELRGLWNASVWLEPDPAALDAVEAGALKLYEKTKPREAATTLIDGTEPDSPRRIFADSC